MKKNNIDVVYRPINSLKFAKYNPRKHTGDQINHLKDSISKFGLVDPIIVNNAPERKDVVIGGHFRLKVARELGLKEIPVVYLNISDIETEKELNIRLNHNIGEWDYDLLKDFDLELLTDVGFEHNMLADIWDGDLEIKDDEFNEKKELDKIKEPKTKPGDLIILGKHKLLCGDSNNITTVRKLFGGDKASMVISDPPYNINLSYKTGLGGKQDYGAEVIDNRTEKEYLEFLRFNISNSLLISKADCHFFYWNTEQQIWMIQTLYRELNIKNKRVCLWIKNGHNPTPQVAFNKCYEPCIYGTVGNPYISKKEQGLSEVMNKDIGNGNDSLDDINIWTSKRIPKSEYKHATSKPIDLYDKPLRRCTKPGDIIYDSFAGSGSSLISAELLNRRAYVIEEQPIFCDLIISRFETLTNIKAKIIKQNEKA